MTGYTGTDLHFPLQIEGLDFTGRRLRADMRADLSADPVAIAFGSPEFGLAGTIRVDDEKPDTLHFSAPYTVTAALETGFYLMELVEDIQPDARKHLVLLEINIRQGGTRW